MQDSWFRALVTPFGGSVSRAWPFTESWLSWLLPWAQAHYSPDVNRIYGAGGSMGAWGTMSYSFQHPEIFAAVFADRPKWRSDRVYNLVPGLNYENDVLVNNSSPLLPDGATVFQQAKDSVAYAQARAAAGATVPWVGWAIGRQDPYAGTSAYWQQHIDAVNALKAAKYGFAFCWDNGDHGTNVYLTTIQAQYASKAPALFALNKTYPAFTNFSLDANPGNGSVTDGDLTGCINAGWNWSNESETANTWSASISNSTVSGSATADVTPRNTQAFRVSPGRQVAWTASTGQSGTATADAHGLVTAAGVQIQAGTATTVSFQTRQALFPLPSPVRRQ